MNTSLSGLQAFQSAINITSENIANVDTEGYSRRSVRLLESVLTGGVTADSVRVADRFVIKQLVESASEMGRLETEKQLS